MKKPIRTVFYALALALMTLVYPIQGQTPAPAKQTQAKAAAPSAASDADIADAQKTGKVSGQDRLRRLPQGRPLLWPHEGRQVYDRRRCQEGRLSRGEERREEEVLTGPEPFSLSDPGFSECFCFRCVELRHNATNPLSVIDTRH